MSQYYKFTNESFENEIRDIVLPSMFPILNKNHIDILEKYVIRLINIIALTFGFSKSDDYYYQLKQNDYQDIKWLITHLLPFLNDKDNNLMNLKSFDEIYLKMKKNVNINSSEPKYVYSNIQYNRFERNDQNYTERSFNEKDIEQNFFLLLDSIKTMANKLHPNWMDILPMTLESYKNEELYKNTYHKMKSGILEDWDSYEDASFNNIDEDSLYQNIGLKCSGLDLNDIYNTISFDLYDEIVPVKWLLYDVPSSNKIYPMVVILRLFFNLSFNLNNVEWDDIDNSKFTKMWEAFVKESEIGNNIVYQTHNISNESLRKLMRGILYSFDKSKSSSSRKIAEESGYIPIPQDKIKETMKIIKIEDYLDEDSTDIPFTLILPSLKSLEPKLVYNFITESLQKFRNTWYGTRLLTSDKKDINTDFKYFAEENKIPITYKNIYNFAKNLLFYRKKINSKDYENYENDNSYDSDFYAQNSKHEYVRYPENWKSLNKQQKDNILQRLNKKYTHWFDITGNIRRLFNKVSWISKFDENEINRIIYENITKKFISIVFESLIIKGVLTKFIPNKKKTNKQITPRDYIYKEQTDVFRTTDENEYWTSAYHFLTGLPYKYMQSFMVKEKGISKEYNYFSFGRASTGNQWYTIYAYDWVAQIGFCHHFLNNRVMFITGATGVGKSTEIPKLFLYFMKALEYIQNPQLICTQPRIAPIRKNAERVSTSLGVPISEYVNKKEVETNNYYIQTRFRGDKSHYKNVSHPMLQYCTDGTFILEVNDPLMKHTFVKDKSKQEDYQFTSKNLYDIIMIDEAHEHKINMDLLLTLLRQATTYNNKIKLVIISATMDNDEPKYRRFFRDINDNRKYPLNTWIEKHKLDRINIDRRYHISPPGMGTRYKVNEFYMPNVKEIDAVGNIINKSDSGDILIFEPGATDINKLVTELNKIMPSNMIAFPYFSKMDEDKKAFVEGIADNLKIYKADRSIPFTDPSINKETLQYGNNSYTRAVIVATNIAEASITINTLKYVVDTGTQKVDKYDYKKRGNIQKQIFIAEENRIQRKGRVGRTSSGDVYYLYEKGKLEDNTIDYEISTKNITLELFNKFKTKENEDVIFSKEHDPNNPTVKITYDNIEKIFNKYGLNKVIEEQYFLNKQYYSYFGNNEFYDYSNYTSLSPYYNSGLDYVTLTDNRGKFYLIHPNELDIKRNINGDITGKLHNDSDELTFTKDGKYSGHISSKKIKSFWQMMIDFLYISFNNKRDDLIKTNIGIEFVKLFETLQLEGPYYGLIRSIIFGIAIGCGNDMIKLASFYMASSMNPIKINKDKVFNHDKSFDSDSKIILYYLKQLDDFLLKLGITLDTNKNAIKLYSKIPEVKKYKLSRDLLLILLGPEDKHTKELNKLIASEDKKSKIIENIEKFINNNLTISLNNNIDAITNWCNLRKLNSQVIANYIYQYCNLKSKLLRKMTTQRIDFMKELTNKFNKTSIFEDRRVNLMDVALIFGYPFNVCKKVDESKYYLSLYNPNLDNIYKIQSLSSYKFKPNTLVDLSHLQNYLLYFTLDIDEETGDDTMICLHKVEPKLITILAHIYNNKVFSRITRNDNLMKQIDKLIEKKLEDKTSDLSHMIINYTKTLYEIEQDLMEYSNKQAIQTIKNLDTNLKF